MSKEHHRNLSRRQFVSRAGLLAGGMVCGTQAWGEPAPTVSGTTGELPRRILGKTKQSVTAITLGTAPCGHSREIGARQVADVVNTGLDAGINFVDTAPI
ncbi:MAG: twin-arginine translocation signal domain-containing protein, partial [Planctomycetes bacterium]|nr:twin-arginine translocation signal domain-containing protein [Planctomycetota bacterium]